MSISHGYSVVNLKNPFEGTRFLFRRNAENWTEKQITVFWCILLLCFSLMYGIKVKAAVEMKLQKFSNTESAIYVPLFEPYRIKRFIDFFFVLKPLNWFEITNNWLWIYQFYAPTIMGVQVYTMFQKCYSNLMTEVQPVLSAFSTDSTKKYIHWTAYMPNFVWQVCLLFYLISLSKRRFQFHAFSPSFI